MKRKPKLTKKERARQLGPAALPCSRSLEDQLGPAGATARRSDHPRDRVRRVDLMTNEELAAVRARDPELHDEMLDEAVSLQEEVMAELSNHGEITRERLKFITDDLPVIATVICEACGTREIARFWRSWDVDDAMQVSGLGEREILRVERALREAWGGEAYAPYVTQFGREGLCELAGMAEKHTNPATFRERSAALIVPMPDEDDEDDDDEHPPACSIPLGRQALAAAVGLDVPGAHVEMFDSADLNRDPALRDRVATRQPKIMAMLAAGPPEPGWHLVGCLRCGEASWNSRVQGS